MPYYICTFPIGKYKKDKVISGHVYRKKLSESEKLFFKPYDSNEPGKTFAEEFEENRMKDDKSEKWTWKTINKAYLNL